MATVKQRDISSVKIASKDLPRGVTAAQVKSHVVAPKHVQGVTIEQVDPVKEKRLKLDIRPKTFKLTPRADLAAFGLAMHTALKDSVTGYMLQVRKDGTLVHSGIWNWSQTPADAGQGWNENRRMHVASVSKFITAVGMVKALDSKGISHDAKIAPHLPSYWSKGSNVDDITFRHLLTHRSGFSGNSSASDYGFMKARVAAGVPAVPGGDYENMNFGLCRILIPIVTGMISKNADFPQFAKDQIWDALTINHFRNYMQANVFTPARVNNVGFASVAGGALAYKHPHKNEGGWNSGDLATVSGAPGSGCPVRRCSTSCITCVGRAPS